MMLSLLFSTAFALPPTGNPGRIAVGSGAIERMDVSDDGEVVVGRDRADESAWLIAVDDWSVHHTPAGDCAVTGAVAVPVTEDFTEVYLSCADGFVEIWAWTAETFVQVIDDSGAPIAYPVTSGEPLAGLWWNGDSEAPLLYALEDTATFDYIHVLDGLTGATDGDVFSSYVTAPTAYGIGFVEGVVDLGTLYIAHGGTNMTTVNLATGAVSFAPTVQGLYSIDDLAAGNGKLWAVDTDVDVLFEFFPSSGSTGLTYPGCTSPRAVVANTDTSDEWLMVSGDGVWVHRLSAGAITDFDDPWYVNTDAELNIQDAVTSGEYTFGGGSGGNVHVITAKPWIEGVSAAPLAGNTGDEITITFTIDAASDWEITLNGDRTGSGDTLASGSTTASDEIVETTVTVSESWTEGANRLYVVATNTALETGHGRVEVSVDTPPEPPDLTDSNVGFGDGHLVLTFEGIADEDLAEYQIWISDEPWESADYATGGPEGFEEGPETPIVVTAEAGTQMSVTFTPLVNGTIYFIGVRSYDTGGLESAMSNVVQGTPEETFTATELAGEKGGGPCATGPAAGWVAIGLAGLVAVARRRWRVKMGPALAVMAALAISVPADAADADASKKKRDRGDLTGQYGNFELRYGGFFTLDDQAIKDVYGEGGHNMLQLEVGPQFFRFFEIDVELGFYQELATTVTVSGQASASRTMLTYWPLGLSGTFRLQLLDEQVIVPHVRLGVDYVVWNELTDNDSDGKDKVNGSKFGNHYAFGGSLLLDTFAPGRASLLEATTGINDTYLTLEWRKQNIDSRDAPWAGADVEGLTFSGTLLTIGLKLDY